MVHDKTIELSVLLAINFFSVPDYLGETARAPGCLNHDLLSFVEHENYCD